MNPTPQTVLTAKELDFVVNDDIQYRLGRAAGEQE